MGKCSRTALTQFEGLWCLRPVLVRIWSCTEWSFFSQDRLSGFAGLVKWAGFLLVLDHPTKINDIEKGT